MGSRYYFGDWVGAENQQDHKQDDWKRGFHSIHLRIDLGIDKGILGRLRKLKIGFEWSLILIIIKTESWLHEGWSDGAKHDDRARSYKGVVISGNTGQQNKERDGRDYYGKGKGKMAEAPDSKWVKVAEKGHKRPSNYHGSYRGESEASRSKAGRREDGRNGPLDVGSGAQDVLTRVASGQLRAYQAPSVTHMEAREEGEIKITGED
ncbi:hypothetical protein DY000_02020180 [Brassica cretica]|uniref:Uncharacterized protein n=1 Tax=Brassica cretica TaxID=69181 RepID=A0ABQ7E740_BRACR|nr:hypothetical protein DY000_02020180 [Brassica cretica]